MKSGYALALVLGGSAALFGFVFEPQKQLLWNRTGSAPAGLYRLSGEPFTPGRWVAVSSRSGPAQWASARGFTGADWPLLKQVAALPGAQICRENLNIFINGKQVAIALAADNLGREMPSWDGCFIVQEDELFLLSSHPRSLDGRYFGATQRDDVDGVAVPLWTFSD
jgi:conjugative transfer signal peptidase TraF